MAILRLQQEGAAFSAAMPGQPHARLSDPQSFVDELLSAIRVNPDATTQKGMADALGVSPRTLSRRLHRLGIAWPPIDRRMWEQLAREAVAARPLRTDSWLITCRVMAATLSDAEAKLRTEDGIFIIEAKRLESASVPALSWRVARSDSP
jgi:hypothetical protein